MITLICLLLFCSIVLIGSKLLKREEKKTLRLGELISPMPPEVLSAMLDLVSATRTKIPIITLLPNSMRRDNHEIN